MNKERIRERKDGYDFDHNHAGKRQLQRGLDASQSQLNEVVFEINKRQMRRITKSGKL